MIDLATAAAFFDNTPIFDPSSGDVLFYGQLEPYDDSRRDGVGAERRILSYDPKSGVQLPALRVVEFSNRMWVVGKSQPDEFEGEVIREKLVVQRADDTFRSGTAAQWLTGTQGNPNHCGSEWNRDVKNLEVTSDAHSFYTLYVGSDMPSLDGEFVEFLGRLNRVVNCNQGSSGLQAVEITELPRDCLKDVTYRRSSTYSRVEGKHVGGSGEVVKALVMPFYDQYRLTSLAALKPSRGDLSLRMMPLAEASKPGDTVKVDDLEYQVVSALRESDGTLYLHLSR